MTRESYIESAEARRRKRERELLLLLLIVIDNAIRESILAYRHTLDWRTVLDNRILGNPDARMRGTLPYIENVLKRTHASGMRLANARIESVVRGVPLEEINLYADASKEFATAMTNAIKQAFWLGIGAGVDIRDVVKKIRIELEAAGYSRLNPFAIELGVERQVVGAFNTGVIDGTMRAEQELALRHVSVLDDRTSDWCIPPRDGIILPVSHPYWRAAVPPLHPRCRSLLMPQKPPYEETYPLPELLAAAPGFGMNPLPLTSFDYQQ